MQLYLDERRTRTVLVRTPDKLRAQVKLSAKMPAAMPTYSVDPDHCESVAVTSLNKMPFPKQRRS